MRTLLIDNYDSYTYNLFHLIATVNGVEPVVVTNSTRLPAERFADFDNIVISPGPGHPGVPGDFGVSAEVIAHSPLPVLGVCLGHQGIALAAGAAVRPAPVPRHGHLTRVRHVGDGLFAGIPQDFVAVRYHSLAVPEPLPENLVATAWAEDGVVMALRHRHRPHFGVQFHPESVATGYGAALLENFRRLTYAASAGRARPVVRVAAPGGPDAPPPAASAAPGSPAASAAPVRYRRQVRVLAKAVDTETAFTTLFATAAETYWLDSARTGADARFSFLGDAGGPLAETVTYRVGDGAVRVRHADGHSLRWPGSIFDYLRRELDRREVVGPELPFDLGGGYVGYLGYELKAECGAVAGHRSDVPDAALIFADRVIAVDHLGNRTYLVALDDGTPTGGARARRWLAHTEAILRNLPPQIRSAVGDTTDARDVDSPGPLRSTAAIEGTLDRDRDRYLADIALCQQRLRAGESYEICLTNTVRLPATTDGLTFYRRLRRANPAPYAAYLKLGGITVACSSPERFLRVDRTGTAESRPIKGTAPRDADPARDAALRDALTTDPKTRAENLMIVDLVRNDLGRVCEVGSVRVPELMVTETYRTVHQLVSTVRGRLRPGVTVIDCVRACFPGGSMTGAPKLRTMEIIDTLETGARGVYSGAIGYFGLDGTADLNIVIRTAVLVDGEWRIGAGGAVVLDSDPLDEFREMLLKANAVSRAQPEVDSAISPVGRGGHR
jgi:para-aminobenzoate synthetase